MGLDIRFYEATERVGPHATQWKDETGREHYCQDEYDHRSVYVWRLHGNPDTFAVTQREFDSEFCFTPTGRSHHWYMGYAGYSIFRACLLHLVRPDLVTPQRDQSRSFYPAIYQMPDDEFYRLPFAELIDFADNEGNYGPEVAAELREDFRTYEHRLDEDFACIFPAWTDQLRERYRGYLAGLDLVGPTGLVDYH